MKRLISLFIAASFLLSASACGGSSPSLWGQYATPTPLGGTSPTSPPPPTLVPTQTAEPIRPLALEPERTPTPTFSEAFVTQEATISAKEASQTAENTPTLLYYAQSGDWLPAIAIRFGVDVNQIASPKILPEKGPSFSQAA